MIYYKILNKKRSILLDKLVQFKDRFYLAGGTGLALQIGHRISEDFDFFTNENFNNEVLRKEMKILCPGSHVTILQDEDDTFTFLLDETIKLSFFRLSYKNILPLVETEYFKLADIQEIAVMKILALPRATYKDYVDLYFILQNNDLLKIFSLAKEKHPELNESIYLKCLLSYNDIDLSPITFMPGKEHEPSNIFEFIKSKSLEFIKINCK